MRRAFLFIVSLAVVVAAVCYYSEHRHDGDTYLEQLEHTLACADWQQYDNQAYGYTMYYPSCFLPAEAEGEGCARFVYAEHLPLREVQYMTIDVWTEVCSDSLAPYREMYRRAAVMGGVCLRRTPTEYLLVARLNGCGPHVTTYRLRAKYVLRQKLWFVQTLVYPEDFEPVVGRLVREVEDWKPFG